MRARSGPTDTLYKTVHVPGPAPDRRTVGDTVVNFQPLYVYCQIRLIRTYPRLSQNYVPFTRLTFWLLHIAVLVESAPHAALFHEPRCWSQYAAINGLPIRAGKFVLETIIAVSRSNQTAVSFFAARGIEDGARGTPPRREQPTYIQRDEQRDTRSKTRAKGKEDAQGAREEERVRYRYNQREVSPQSMSWDVMLQCIRMAGEASVVRGMKNGIRVS